MTGHFPTSFVVWVADSTLLAKCKLIPPGRSMARRLIRQYRETFCFLLAAADSVSLSPWVLVCAVALSPCVLFLACGLCHDCEPWCATRWDVHGLWLHRTREMQRWVSVHGVRLGQREDRCRDGICMHSVLGFNIISAAMRRPGPWTPSRLYGDHQDYTVMVMWRGAVVC